MNIIFVIGPTWQNLNTLLKTIEINKSRCSNIKHFYIPTNDKNVDKYFKDLNDENITSFYFSENQGWQLSCYNSIIAGMKMVINNEEQLNNDDIVIFSHEDCYINNIDLFHKAISKLNQNYNVVCRKYNGSIVNSEDYYMNDTFFIKKNAIKNIFDCIDMKQSIETNYFCEKYFSQDISKCNIFYILYTHSTWGDTELGFYHIPSYVDTNVCWDKNNIDFIYD